MMATADKGGRTEPLDQDGGLAADRAVTALLRLEGGVALAAGAAAFAALGAPWWLFAVLFFTPDLAMLGYLRGPRPGAVAYNAAHTYLAPAAVALAALTVAPAAGPIAAVWVAHIGFDRLMGYGLKLPTGFNHTHLGRIGRR